MKARKKLLPPVNVGEPQLWSSPVAVCGDVSLFVQRTLSPALIVTLLGEKPDAPIETSCIVAPPVGAGLGVGDAPSLTPPTVPIDFMPTKTPIESSPALWTWSA